MREVELKILNIDPVTEENKLKKLGFKKTWEGIILEKIFDREDKSLKKKKYLLRLRSIRGEVELTFKGKKEKHPFLKIREEKEIIVNSFEKTQELLEALGFICMAAREKKRKSYKLKDVKIEIDEYPTAKPYLEIEGSEEEVLTTLKNLNYTIDQTTKVSSTQILKMYGLNPKNLIFGEDKNEKKNIN